MGNPLGPALANIFVGFYEQKLFDQGDKPSVYFRYVDDTCVIFESERDCDLFHEKLNLLHPALKFAIEKEQNSSLNFLDVSVDKRALNLLPVCTGNQRFLVITSAGIPLAPKKNRSH